MLLTSRQHFFDQETVFFRFLAEIRLRTPLKSPQKQSSRPISCNFIPPAPCLKLQSDCFHMWSTCSSRTLSKISVLITWVCEKEPRWPEKQLLEFRMGYRMWHCRRACLGSPRPHFHIFRNRTMTSQVLDTPRLVWPENAIKMGIISSFKCIH